MNDYLSDLYKRLSGKMKLGLQRSRQLMAFLDHPEADFRSIHIAGTNGKGTVTAVTASLLQACGYRTGRFTSPHLIHFNERIQIDGLPLPDEKIQWYLSQWQEELDRSGASFFEITTALAFAAFRDEGVDAAVVETGLGGRLDATSVLIPDVTVITSISYDHTHILGDTLAEIAAEKAGIIKDGVPCITCFQEKEALDQLRRSDPEILQIPSDKVICEQMEPHGMTLKIKGYPGHFHIPLTGRHHCENIALAVSAAEEFIGRALTEEELDEGLSAVFWPGRFQILQEEDPVCVYDVGHNPGGAKAVRGTLEELYPEKKITCLLGVMKDKDVSAMLEICQSVCARIAMFPVASERGFGREEMEKIKKDHPQVIWYDSLEEALNIENDPRRCEVLLILGSHYPAADIYDHFNLFDGEDHE